LKHPDATVVTYKRRQIEHLKQVYVTLVKTHEKHCKHMQHPDETLANIQKKTNETLKINSETLVKTHEKHLKSIANICNIQMKHSQTYI
jgi:hypothetical protein